MNLQINLEMESVTNLTIRKKAELDISDIYKWYEDAVRIGRIFFEGIKNFII